MRKRIESQYFYYTDAINKSQVYDYQVNTNENMYSNKQDKVALKVYMAGIYTRFFLS